MAQSFTVIVYVAAPGTPLKAGGTSLPGHMYYATETEGKKRSYGFAPTGHGDANGPGKIYTDDVDNYLNPRYARHMEVTAAAYEKLTNFGDNPAGAQFSMTYNGLSNSCIDFTWTALRHADLHTENIFGYQFKNNDGAVKPLENIGWIRRIKAPLPKSALNREFYNAMPSRSPLQWLLSDNGRPMIGQRGRNA